MKEQPEKNKGGRPAVVISEEQLDQIEKLAAFLNTEQMCDYLGIAARTFLAIRDRQPEVSAAYKRGKAKAVASVAKGLLQNALDGDTPSQMFYLKTQAGWREKQQLDVVSSDGSMTPKTELTGDALRKELDKRGLKIEFDGDNE